MNTTVNNNLNLFSGFNSVSSQLQNVKLIDLKANDNLISPNLLFSSNLSLSTAREGSSNNLISLFDNNKVENNQANPVKDSIKGKVMGKADGTGYYPHNSKLEGGYVDKIGKKLNTLQDFLDGKASYVSIALDKNLYKKGVIKYGDKFRIPELEKKYGRKIEFRAVDTGGAFTNKNFGRVDICTRSEKHSLEKTVNGTLTLIKTN